MKRFFTSYYQSRLNEWELVTCDAEMLRMMRAPASVVLAHESKRCKDTVQQLECTVGLRVQIQDVAVKSLSWKDERHSGFRGRGTPDLWLPIRGIMTNRKWCTSILFLLWRYFLILFALRGRLRSPEESRPRRYVSADIFLFLVYAFHQQLTLRLKG